MTNGAQPHRVRKTVTIVCCDLRDSTGMGERFDVESLGEVIARYREAMREVLERHGAKTDISGGDAVIGQFGEPTVHEDDALRAVRAALEMREKLADLNDDVRRTWGIHLAIKIGVNTGEVVAGDLAYDPRMVTADAANVAARLEHAAEGGEILIGEPTYRLVRDVVEVEALGPLTLRGKARPVTAFRLLAVSEPAPGIVRPLDSPLVGRERELARLLDAFELARADKIPGIVTVFGPPGIGKSRIAKELAARLEGRVWALRGRCLPYGDGITFWPIAEVVRSAARIREADSPVEATAKIATLMPTDPEAGDVAKLLAEAIGVTDGSADRQGIFWAFKKLVSSLSSQRPLLLLLDDLHWGEPTFLELVQELAQDEDAGALLIVALARPELLAALPGWPRGGGRALSVELEPLAPRESRRLLERQLGLVEDTVLERIT
jgi:class 3 adenylate cyclase